MDLLSKGFFLEVQDPSGAPSGYDHQFCGSPKIAGASCPLCQRDLLRFFSLDLRDPAVRELLPGEWADVPFLHLLYCWRCGDTLTYTLLSSGGVTVLQGPLTREDDDYPYEGYPDGFPPKRATLRPVPDDIQDILRRGNREGFWEPKFDEWLVPRHQLGGEPYLSQSSVLDSAEKCQECGRNTALLASVGNDNGTPEGFAGDEFVQVVFFLCGPCRTLDAYNMCD